jgi:hypothetical protein
MVVAAVTFLVARLTLRRAVIGAAAAAGCVSGRRGAGRLASGGLSRMGITRATAAKIPCAPSSASIAA